MMESSRWRASSSGLRGPRPREAPSSPPAWPASWAAPYPWGWVSACRISSQRDSERAQIDQEKRELADNPRAELTELTALYEAKGPSAATARSVAAELTARDALDAHLDAERTSTPTTSPARRRPPAPPRCRSSPVPCCRCSPSS